MSVFNWELMHLYYWFFDCPFFEAFESMRMTCICQTKSSPNAHECFLRSLTAKIHGFSKVEVKMAALHLFPRCTELLGSKISMEFCRQLLDRCEEETRDHVLQDVDVCAVIQDEEGCRLIEHICEKYGDESKAAVFHKIRQTLASLCVHKWGSAPIQTLLSEQKMPDVFEVFDLVADDVHTLIKHENGTACVEILLNRAVEAGDPEYLCQNTGLPKLLSNLLQSLGASIWTSTSWAKHVLELLTFFRGETANKFVQVVAPNFLECWMTPPGRTIIMKVLKEGTITCKRGIIDGILALRGEQKGNFLRTRESYDVLQQALRADYKRMEVNRLLPKRPA